MSAKYEFFQVSLPGWESAKRIKNQLDHFIFRGQSDYQWGLTTSLERALKPFRIPPDEMWDLEKNILSTFRSRAHHYIQSPPEKQSYLEWLALIQHHGGVTRLLDFTESFYIAWYFALEDALRQASVWAVNVEHLLKKARSFISRDSKTQDFEKPDPVLSLAELFIKNNESNDLVLPVKPNRLNERIAIQKGTFLFPCNMKNGLEQNLCLALDLPTRSLNYKNIPRIDIDELLDENTNIIDDIKILKMNLEVRHHNDAISDLYSMNIAAASLFPGLEGFARSLKYSVRLREQSTYLSDQILEDMDGLISDADV